MFIRGSQLSPAFISKRRQSFCKLNIYNEHAFTGEHQFLQTFTNFNKRNMTVSQTSVNVGQNVLVWIQLNLKPFLVPEMVSLFCYI